MDLFALATLPTRADEAEGTATTNFYALRDNLFYLPPGAKLARAKPVLVAAGKLTFSGVVTGKVVIRLTAAGTRLLRHAKRLALTTKESFRPTGQAAISASASFLVRR